MTITKNKKIELSPEFFGEKTIIISKSGYGKSYTARVIIEDGIKLKNTFIVIDPQDAYLNMPDFAYIDVAKVKSARGLAILLGATNRNTVLQVKRLSIDNQNKFLKSFLEEYRMHMQKGIRTIVIDEMHKFAPESEKSDAKEVIRGMCQENRSDGLGFIGISQRVSRIDKTCLSQADNLCIGKVTSFRDKEAVKNYIDNPDDLEKISKLEKGQFYFYGFGLSEAEIGQVRKSETEHSGASPQNLLNEDSQTFHKHLGKYYKGSEKMSDQIESKDVVHNIVPGMDGFKDLAVLGAKVSLGMAAGGIVGTFVGSKFASPIPVLSSRTLGAAASTIVLYTGYRMMPVESVKDVLKYAAAGSAVFTAGSLVFDVLTALKVNLPGIVSYALATATGASPAVAEKQQSESGSNVDLNTAMA